MDNLVVTPLTAVIGAEITGVDLGTELDGETVAALRQALLDHLVLFFRDQDFGPAAQLRLAERFAPVMTPLIDPGGDVPGLTILDQVSPKGQYTERWHADSTFLAEPPLGAILRAVQLPSVGGDTCWASMYAAHDSLSPAMQEFLAVLTAEHSTQILERALAGMANVSGLGGDAAPTVHPVVRVHPESGRRALFVNRNFTDRIVGLTEAESQALLAMLFEHIGRPEHMVRFRWTPGSVAFWDNRCTQHCAIADYDERRLMHRCLLTGDQPVGPG